MAASSSADTINSTRRPPASGPPRTTKSVSTRSSMKRACLEVGDPLRDPEQGQRLGVLQHRDDEALAVRQLDREAEVDEVPRDDLVAADLAVDPRVVAQGLDRRPGHEGQVRRIDAVR